MIIVSESAKIKLEHSEIRVYYHMLIKVIMKLITLITTFNN